MDTKDFFYELPESQIAQTPAEPRDHARMLVMDKNTGEMLHRHFYDLPRFLRAGDVLVINNTRVIPARLYGVIDSDSRRAVECLLIKRRDLNTWEIIAKPAKKLKVGTRVIFGEELAMVVEGILENGMRLIRFEFEGVFESILDKLGNMPLPPYIKTKLEDKERYQTVYSKIDGSAAAPTAGLHFTNELLQRIRDMGVEVVEVLLHVGLSTFRPVTVERVEDHKMHTEYYEISPEAAERINRAKRENRRVIAVGTTSVRTLEAAATEKGHLESGHAETSIFIYPPYDFKIVDCIITNFHLPESTLIMLVSAFAGRERVLDMYNTAVAEGYRFFSFGDATLLTDDISEQG